MMQTLLKIVEIMKRQGFPCLFQLFTGLYCPGCGGTRALRALLHGKLILSFQYHPLVLYGLLAVLAEGAGWLISKLTGNPRWYPGHEVEVICVGAGIVLVNWLYKNYMLVARGIDLLPPWPF
ncbi:MAG: DUF2752 domain-containing protein [Enterocloster sp.]